MKSTPTPHTKVGKTTQEIRTEIGKGHFKYPVVIPTGTRCHFLQDSHWVVADLSWLPRSDGAYHDADYYGIVVTEDQLTDVREVPKR